MHKVLVVDDSRSMRLLVSRALGAGFEFAEAPDGATALEQLNAGGFALVITDLNMPVMDGLDLTRALLKRGDFTPVLLVTSDPDRAKQHSKEAGVSGWLGKPLDAAALTAAVNRLL